MQTCNEERAGKSAFSLWFEPATVAWNLELYKPIRFSTCWWPEVNASFCVAIKVNHVFTVNHHSESSAKLLKNGKLLCKL